MDQGTTNSTPGAKPASKQQQAQFDLLLGRCRQVMGESAQEWLQTLQQDPVGGAVMLGTQTLRELAGMSEKAGQKVDPVVLINVGVQLVKDVAGVANAAGLVSDEELEDFLKEVMQQSIGEYLRMDADDGLLSADDKSRAQQVVGQAGAAGGAGGAAPPQGMLARMQQGGA